MKKRKKSKDSCLVLLLKIALCMGTVMGVLLWGLVCEMRTVNYSLWTIPGCIVVSYLLLKLFKSDENAIQKAILCSFFLDAAICITNFYFPISVQQRKAVVQDIYMTKHGRSGSMQQTHYVLYFTDNGQEADISGRLATYNYHEGDTVSVTYQHGWIGWDVVADIK